MRDFEDSMEDMDASVVGLDALAFAADELPEFNQDSWLYGDFTE